jgi:tetratricopeptide (TPR) repeat protein
MFVDISMMQRLNNEHDESMQSLLQALDEKEHEAALVGEQCLTKVLMIVADRFCQMQKFQMSFPYFDRALNILNGHVGPNHLSVGTYSYLAGQAHAAAKDYETGLAHLHQAIAIFEAHPENRGEVEKDLDRARWLVNYCHEKLGSVADVKPTTRSNKATSSASVRTSAPSHSSSTVDADDEEDDPVKNSRKRKNARVRSDL